jgi:hypothetical protein
MYAGSWPPGRRAVVPAPPAHAGRHCLDCFRGRGLAVIFRRLQPLLEGARRLPGELAERAAERLRAVVADGLTDLRDAFVALRQQTRGAREPHAADRRADRLADDAGVDAMEMERREVRDRGKVFETILGKRIGDDGRDDACDACTVVLFGRAGGHAASVPSTAWLDLADFAIRGSACSRR